MEKVNLELPRAWGSQTTSGHTFHTRESRFLPSPLPSGKDKDGRPLATDHSESDCFVSGKNSWKNL